MLTARFSVFLCTQRGQTQPAKKDCSNIEALWHKAVLLPSCLPASHWGENTEYWGWEARAPLQLSSNGKAPIFLIKLIFAGTKDLRDMRSTQPSAGSHPLFPLLSLQGREMRCKIWSPLNYPVFSGCQMRDACQQPEGCGDPFLFLIPLDKPLSAAMAFLHGQGQQERSWVHLLREAVSISLKEGRLPASLSQPCLKQPSFPTVTFLYTTFPSPMAIPDQHNPVLD